MTPPEFPKVPEPDTHCFDEDTGKDVWSHSTAQLIADRIACAEWAMERAAAMCEQLRDVHCEATQLAPDPAYHCHAEGHACDFVAAWNDAAAAIRSITINPEGAEK